MVDSIAKRLAGASRPTEDAALRSGCLYEHCGSTPVVHGVCFEHALRIYLQLNEEVRYHWGLASPAKPPKHALTYDEARLAVRDRHKVVYYMQIGAFIKIGFTSNLGKRLEELASGAMLRSEVRVLAAEPGDFKLEHQRHVEFAMCRVERNRELFAPIPELLQHVKNVRSQYGEPKVLSATEFAREVQAEMGEPLSAV